MTAKLRRWTGVREEYLGPFQSLWFALFVIAMGWGITQPLLTVRIVQKGATYQQLGVLQSCAAMASILTQVWIGKLSDRLGRRKPLVVAGLLLAVPVVALYPRAEALLAFGILYALHNVTYNTYRSMMTAWVSNWAPNSSMGRTHGSFRIAGSLGWIVASPFLGTLLDKHGFGPTFSIAAVIYAVMAFFIAGMVKEERIEYTDEKSDELENAASTPGSVDGVWTMELKLFLVALTVFSLSQSMGYNLNSVFLVEELGVSNTQFGWIVSLQAWLEVPLMFGLGVISDHFNPANILGLSILISGLRWFLLSVVTNTSWVFGIQALNAIGVTVTEVLAVAFLARLVPSGYLGTIMGWKITMQSIATLSAPLIAGNVAYYLGIRTVFKVSAMMALISFLILMKVSRSRTSTRVTSPEVM